MKGFWKSGSREVGKGSKAPCCLSGRGRTTFGPDPGLSSQALGCSFSYVECSHGNDTLYMLGHHMLSQDFSN